MQQKATADRMRALPLPDVLTPWASSRTKRSLTAGRLTGSTSLPPKGRSWEVVRPHRPARRGGAIDLVQHITGADFKGALSWLADRFEKAQPPPILRARMRAEAVRQVKEAKTEREPFTALPYPGALAESAEILGGGSRPARALHRQAASAGRLLRRRPPQRRLHLQGR